MESPSARLLRLLVLLQSRPRWTGPDLVESVKVSPRTLRYDIDKLRKLGYPVHAESGPAGGYALRPGGSLPPLQLDDGEAVAMAIGLRAASGIADLAEDAASALVKLDQVLPTRLRLRFTAFRTFTESLNVGGPQVDPDVLLFLTGACRDQRMVGFQYRSSDGADSHREVEPYRLTQLNRRWYLVAFDPDRDDWRNFRIDRMAVKHPEGRRFTARKAPASTSLVDNTDAYYRRYRATVLVAASAETVSRRVPGNVPVEHVDDARCRVYATGETAAAVAMNLLLLEQDFTLEATSDDVIEALRCLQERIQNSIAL